VREQDKAEGHAVRAVYLYSGMTDTALETEDDTLYEVCKRLWNNITAKQMYITGAIGASSYGESFTFDYDLPNDTAYAETCASIGLVFFAIRMLKINADSHYSDIMEKALYNNIIAGMQLDGTKFFYVNPLSVFPESCEKDQIHRHVKPERQKWFSCACCPPNIARMISSLGGYIYTAKNNTMMIHLYISNTVNIKLNNIKTDIQIQSELPQKGTVTVLIKVEKPANFTVALRVPEWCTGFICSINGRRIEENSLKNGYLYLTRIWKTQNKIELNMEMPVRTIEINPMVRQNIGRVAVTRGPIVYCIEEADNGKNMERIFLTPEPKFKEIYEPDTLGGITALYTEGLYLDDSSWDTNTLYRPERPKKYTPKPLKFIPYYSWANRKVGEMMVWVKKL
jgi:DUF1680 family protein